MAFVSAKIIISTTSIARRFFGKSCKDCIEVGSQTWLLATALSEVSKINDGMSRENGEVAVLLSCRHDAFFCSLIWLIKMASLSPSSFHLKVFVLHYFEAAPRRRWKQLHGGRKTDPNCFLDEFAKMCINVAWGFALKTIGQVAKKLRGLANDGQSILWVWYGLKGIILNE